MLVTNWLATVDSLLKCFNLSFILKIGGKFLLIQEMRAFSSSRPIFDEEKGYRMEKNQIGCHQESLETDT